MSIETQTPLPKEQLDAYNELAKEAQSTEDLVTLREMAEADTASQNHHIEVKDDSGEVTTIRVTDIGKGALRYTPKPEGLAVSSESWQTEEK